MDIVENNHASVTTGARSAHLPGAVEQERLVIEPADGILVTGAAGFIGSRVVASLLDHGFCNLRCLVRPSSDLTRIESILTNKHPKAHVEILKGNLLSREDCEIASKGVRLILHLAASTSEKSFPDAFMNSVVTTRNLLDASMKCTRLRRFVLVSSFAVYTNRGKPHRRLLDESCPIEEHPEDRSDAYCFAKVKQEQLVSVYGETFGIPYVVVRPGSVYGPDRNVITGRVGISTFGFFLHLGGSNTIPFTYVDNCADAIVLAGLVRGIDGEAFNVVDDDLPSSRQFLRLYKKKVRRFRSVYVPHAVSHTLCYLWEKYSQWSEGQLPPIFNRSRWHAEWKRTHYSNDKLKETLGWVPQVSTTEGLWRSFRNCREGNQNA